ncbi:hypothetical protein [Loktanella sp. Alg231-35]|uniref:hypothetical protein n=1 Tax=Loktanella sp. Alg231-35 TaxID=1922220 RepID=UPI001F3ED5AB|nr:hypothetical protein [Loktanella sp. Alg231-35]
MLRLIAVFIVCAGAVTAQEWRALSGAEIAAALTDRSLTYPNATQHFYASGRTLYNAGQDSWGYWAVRGDQYCSQWPPGALWDCYDMAVMGDALRFVGADGSTTDGVYAQ